MSSETGNGNGAFPPDAVAAINQAYEGAIAELEIRHAHSERRAHLARTVMDLAKDGETDAARLQERAVGVLRRYDRVAARAHELWKAEGCPGDRQDAHWQQAEREIGGAEAR